MQLRRMMIALFLAALTGCQGTVSHAQKSRGHSEAGVQGKLGHGLIADHYDRDGDGRYEECRRGPWTYFDRNGDGLVDLQIFHPDDYSSEVITWDEDFDGIMDWSCVHDMSDFSPGWSRPRAIHEAAARIFLDDRIARVEPIPASGVGWHAWDGLTQRAADRQ